MSQHAPKQAGVVTKMRPVSLKPGPSFAAQPAPAKEVASGSATPATSNVLAPPPTPPASVAPTAKPASAAIHPFPSVLTLAHRALPGKHQPHSQQAKPALLLTVATHTPPAPQRLCSFLPPAPTIPPPSRPIQLIRYPTSRPRQPLSPPPPTPEFPLQRKSQPSSCLS